MEWVRYNLLERKEHSICTEQHACLPLLRTFLPYIFSTYSQTDLDSLTFVRFPLLDHLISKMEGRPAFYGKPSLLGLPRKVRSRVLRHLAADGYLNNHLHCISNGRKLRKPPFYNVVQSNLRFDIARVCKQLNNEAIRIIYRCMVLELCHDQESLYTSLSYMGGTMIEYIAQLGCRNDGTEIMGTELGDRLHQMARNGDFMKPEYRQPLQLGPVNLLTLPGPLRQHTRQIVIHLGDLEKISPQLDLVFMHLKYVTTRCHVYVSRPKKATSKQIVSAFRTQLDEDVKHATFASWGLKALSEMISDKRRFEVLVDVCCLDKSKKPKQAKNLKELDAMGAEQRREEAAKETGSEKEVIPVIDAVEDNAQETLEHEKKSDNQGEAEAREKSRVCILDLVNL